MRRKKTAEELERSFFFTKTDIGRYFGIGRKMAEWCFKRAREIDEKEFGMTDDICPNWVRKSTAMAVLGLSNEDKE